VGEFLKELEMTEGRGTGIPKMLREIRKNGSPEPIFHTDDDRTFFLVEFPIHPVFAEALKATPEVTPEVRAMSGLSRDQVEILDKVKEDQGITDLMAVIGRKNRTKFRDQVLRPLINNGLVEMTIPDKPRSSKQKYRLTTAGKKVLKELKKGENE